MFYFDWIYLVNFFIRHNKNVYENAVRAMGMVIIGLKTKNL